jgi:hypothetical protein
VLRLDVGERLADAVDRPSGDSGRIELLKPFRCGLMGDAFGDHGDDGAAVGDSRAVGREALVARPLRMPADCRQARELAVVADRDDDRLVGGVETAPLKSSGAIGSPAA